MAEISDEQVEAARNVIESSFQSHSWEFGIPRRDVRLALEAALLPRPMEAGVPKVKALEWRNLTDGRYSGGFRPNEYAASWYNVSLRREAWRIDDGHFTFMNRQFDTRDEAMAAAQIDYEHRILSALEGRKQ